jgi:hypothetical protein
VIVPIVQRFLDDLSEFDFFDSYVPTTAAMGDTRKYTTTYTIGKYEFEYYHVLPEGEIASSELKIKRGPLQSKTFRLFKF